MDVVKILLLNFLKLLFLRNHQEKKHLYSWFITYSVLRTLLINRTLYRIFYSLKLFLIHCGKILSTTKLRGFLNSFSFLMNIICYFVCYSKNNLFGIFCIFYFLCLLKSNISTNKNYWYIEYLFLYSLRFYTFLCVFNIKNTYLLVRIDVSVMTSSSFMIRS